MQKAKRVVVSHGSFVGNFHESDNATAYALQTGREWTKRRSKKKKVYGAHLVNSERDRNLAGA